MRVPVLIVLALGLVISSRAPLRAAQVAPASQTAKTNKPKPSSKKKRVPTTAGANGGRSARQKGARPQPATINEAVKITPFPSHAGAAKKALAQNRRDQIDDAEKAARSPEPQADRWDTVLFHLRNLDARADAEGCFWRLVAYYRLGQIERARALRQSCELAPKDQAAVEAEDSQAANLQPAATQVEKETNGATPAAVSNPAPYTGLGPTRVSR